METFADTEGRRWYLAGKAPLSTNLSALAGYLRQHDIAHRINEARGMQVIWVADTEHAAKVGELLDGLSSGAIQIQTESNENADQQTSEWQHFFNHGQLAFQHIPITCLLLMLSITGWIIVIYDPRLTGIGQWLTFVDYKELFFPPRTEHHFPLTEPWRTITPIFLHFSIFHIIFNSVILWSFGGRIEFVMGSLQYLAMVIFASVVSNVGQYLWQPEVTFGGMSGVNYAFVGYLWMRQLFAPHPALAIPMGIIGFMLLWLVLGVLGIIDMFMAGGIANGAHVAGLLAGVSWGVVESFAKPKRHANN